MTTQQPEQTAAQVTAATLAVEFAAVAEELSARAIGSARTWFVGWMNGLLTDTEFIASLADTLTVWSEVGVMKADQLAASLLGRVTVGLDLDTGREDQHIKAAETLVTDLDKPQDGPVILPGRLERLASSVPVAEAQDGLRRAYRAHGLTGYVRGLDAAPCELCQWLFKDGYVYPINKTMDRHPGCQCVPVPVGTDELPAIDQR